MCKAAGVFVLHITAKRVFSYDGNSNEGIEHGAVPPDLNCLYYSNSLDDCQLFVVEDILWKRLVPVRPWAVMNGCFAAIVTGGISLTYLFL